jgi:MFS family permease
MAMIESVRLRRMRWLSVFLCAAAISINYLDRSTTAVANLDIRRDFGINATQFGALQSAWSFFFAMAQIPAGFLVDRIGPRILMGASLAFWSIAVAAGGFALTYRQLLIARAMLGVTEAPAYPAAVRVTADWFRIEKRGLPTGIFNMGANLGTAIAPPLLTVLMITAGWRWMFIIAGILGMTASIIWLWLYREPHDASLSAAELAVLGAGKPQSTSLAATGQRWGRLFRFRTTWGLVAGGFCVGYGLWMYITWFPGYLETAHHLSVARTGVLASIPLIWSIMGSFFGGYASDRLIKYGVQVVRARKLPTSAGLLGSGLFTALAAGATNPESAILWVSLSMFCLYFSIAAKWTLITAVSPRHYAGSVSGLQNFGSYLGGTLSPVLTGFVVDNTCSFITALMIGGGFMTAGAVIYFFLIGKPISETDLGAAPAEVSDG